MQAAEILQKHFREYYSSHPVKGPLNIENREFGFGTFGQKISQRHLLFGNENELNSFLTKEVPLFLSYSAAYYKFPDKRPMNNKQLIKSDLIYEFDADDIKTECKQEHDKWHCEKCHASGKGLINNCTTCGERVITEEWICGKCLEATKIQLYELYSLLQQDLGITKGISINFSGGKGYHLHVRNTEIESLSKSARIELLDYLTLHEISIVNHGFYLDPNSKQMKCPLPSQSAGWSKRILDTIIKKIEKGNTEQLAAYGGVRISTVQKLLQEKETIILNINRGVLQQLPGRKTEAFWTSVIGNIINELRLDIDRQTSSDIHKIIRLPNTLHGGTGLIAAKISEEKLESYMPLQEAVVFGDSAIKIKMMKETPRFEIGKENFSSFEKGQEVELPLYAGIYLIAKGAADGS